MKSLYVSGKFDDAGGRPSKIARRIFETVKLPEMNYYNGGRYGELEKILDSIGEFKLVYWFADVDNSKEKLVKEIKNKNNACILVTSKRNAKDKYSFADLVYHALNIKSNLFVEFGLENSRYYGRVIDPLGNVFLDRTDNFDSAGKALKQRTDELMKYTRISSRQIGEKIEAPNEEKFFSLVKEYADKFHKLIHAHPEAVNRFFGNASFRCENGFPSFKDKNLIHVSKRNVDKREISSQSFVAVNPKLPLEYFGSSKPSVDSPIQVKLYEYYQDIRYMLHAHVYIENVPFTEHIVPCGAVEEFNEIIKLFPDRKSANFSVNLKGHGSLILVNNSDNLKYIHYLPRNIPEIHESYLL